MIVILLLGLFLMAFLVMGAMGALDSYAAKRRAAALAAREKAQDAETVRFMVWDSERGKQKHFADEAKAKAYVDKHQGELFKIIENSGKSGVKIKNADALKNARESRERMQEARRMNQIERYKHDLNRQQELMEKLRAEFEYKMDLYKIAANEAAVTGRVPPIPPIPPVMPVPPIPPMGLDHADNVYEFEAVQEPAMSTWDQARARHEAVAEAWGAIVADPLSTLEHSLLLDVSASSRAVHTVAFVEAYGRLTDYYSLISTGEVSTDQVDKYADLARETEAKWTVALTASERAKYDWLPETDRDNARRAAGALASAADESYPMEVRAAYARKAAELLTAITTVIMPRETVLAIEARYRELEAGPILKPAPQREVTD